MSSIHDGTYPDSDKFSPNNKPKRTMKFSIDTENKIITLLTDGITFNELKKELERTLLEGWEDYQIIFNTEIVYIPSIPSYPSYPIYPNYNYPVYVTGINTNLINCGITEVNVELINQ